MSAFSSPRKFGPGETSEQTMFRRTNFSNGSLDFGTEFSQIVWSKVHSCVTKMSPNKLHGIELGRTDRKGIDVQTRLGTNEVLNQTPLVDGMVVPDQNNGTCNAPQDLLQEEDDVFTTQIRLKGSHRQLHLSSPWTHQDCAHQVQTPVVVQTGVHTRRLSTGCPTASKRRNQ
jgi:hypothetical protein